MGDTGVAYLRLNLSLFTHVAPILLGRGRRVEILAVGVGDEKDKAGGGGARNSPTKVASLFGGGGGGGGGSSGGSGGGGGGGGKRRSVWVRKFLATPVIAKTRAA